MSLLTGEILYEAAKFIIMLLLLVCSVFVGGALRKRTDAKKAAKEGSHSVQNRESLYFLIFSS